MSFNWVYTEANNAAHVLAIWSLNNSVFGSFSMGRSQYDIEGSCPGYFVVSKLCFVNKGFFFLFSVKKIIALF